MITVLPPETDLHGRYTITRKLGQGGMGAVYLAHDRVLDYKVAIKENFDTTPSAQKQFEREARILAPLRHHNLPRVTDYFIADNGRQYLVMDYVQGQDLEKIVADRGPVPERHALEWMGQVFDAVQYLHSQQPEPVIHRDIKPSNLKQGSDGRIILVDFGIAKHLQPLQGTVTGARAVSPGFSPPEQYSRDVRTDQRSDIYALGATMYFLLSGTPPPESVLRQGGVRLDSLQERDKTITDRTNAVVMKMLQLDPDERYQTVNEVRQIFSTTHPLSAPESILDKSKPETADRRATPHLSEPGTPTSQITLSRLPQPMRALQIPLKTTIGNAIDQVFDVTRRGLVDEIANDIIGEARSIEGNTILLFGCSGCGTSKIATEIIRVVESNGGPNYIAAAISLVNDKYLDHPIEMWNDIVSGLGWQATHRVADDLNITTTLRITTTL